MKECKKSFALQQNIGRIIFNYVADYIWENEDINKSINDTLNYYSEDFGLVNDMTSAQIKEYIIKTIELYSNNYRAVRKAIYKIKEACIVKSVKQLFDKYELPFKSILDYQLFIRHNLLPFISK